MGRSSGFKLEEVGQALASAGAGEEFRKKVLATLAGSRKPGRKPEPDDDLLARLAQAVADGKKPYAAARHVTEGMPEPLRKQVRGRIYRKYNVAQELWQEKALQARLTAEEERAKREQQLAEAHRKKMEAMRAVMGP